MGLLVNSTDFVGDFAIPQDQYTRQALDLLIAQTEQNHIYSLLGADLGAAFIADITDGAPTNPLYLAIFNAFQFDYYGEVVISNGMKEMLIRFIFFDWTRRLKYEVGITGATEKRATNSLPAKYDSNWLVRIYNGGIDIQDAIRLYIIINHSDYPTFSGKRIGYSLAW
jgi:hypothetical protein